MTFISFSRELLQVDLRTYGEEDLALRVPTLTDAEMKNIGEIAGRNATTGGCTAHRQGVSSSGGRVLGRNQSSSQTKSTTAEGNLSGLLMRTSDFQFSTTMIVIEIFRHSSCARVSLGIVKGGATTKAKRFVE